MNYKQGQRSASGIREYIYEDLCTTVTSVVGGCWLGANKINIKLILLRKSLQNYQRPFLTPA